MPPLPPPPARDALDQLDALLRDTAERAAAYIAGQAARRAELTWEHKGPADFVSHVDRTAESMIRDALLAAHLDAVFVGEESYDPAQGLGDALAFVVDPLDGTTNFLHGFPWYAVSIGATWAGELVAGVVHNAATGERFSATAGGGAWRRATGTDAAERIAVSTVAEPARALIGTGFPFKSAAPDLPTYLRQFARVAPATAGMRRAGSAALDLCDVACGRFDAFWELSLSPWDLAAGVIILKEAGATVTDPHGRPARVTHTGLCAGNPAMHAWLLDVLRTA